MPVSVLSPLFFYSARVAKIMEGFFFLNSQCILKMASCFESQNFAWRLTRITIGLSHIWARCKTRLNILGTFLIWFGSRRGWASPCLVSVQYTTWWLRLYLEGSCFISKYDIVLAPSPWNGSAYLRQPLWGHLLDYSQKRNICNESNLKLTWSCLCLLIDFLAANFDWKTLNFSLFLSLTLQSTSAGKAAVKMKNESIWIFAGLPTSSTVSLQRAHWRWWLGSWDG